MAKYALVCGVNTYVNDAFRPLLYGINDVVRIEKLLASCGYRVEMLPGMKLRDDSLRDAIGRLVKNSAPNDTILFYFSGHGCSLGGEQYVLPYNSIFDGQYLKNGIDLHELAKLTKKSSVNRLFIVDACRDLFQSKSSAGSNQLSLTRKGISNLIDTSSQESPLSIICACSDGQFSFESKTLRGGIFTSMLIEVFMDKIEKGERLTLFDVSREVDEKLRSLPARIGEYFPQQPPWILGQNIVLVEGELRPSSTIDFFDRRLDIESEEIACEFCAENRHFTDLKRCLACDRLVCPSHFGNADDACCQICISEGLKVVELEEINRVRSTIRQRKHDFFDAFVRICPTGTLKFNQKSTPQIFVNEFCENLRKRIAENQPSVGDVSILKRDMLIEAFYGFVPAQFVSNVKPHRLFSKADFGEEWDRCELKLRRSMLWGEYV